MTFKLDDTVCYDPADYIFVNKEHYADLMYLLKSAHEELTNHGHEELSECGCRIASTLNRRVKP